MAWRGNRAETTAAIIKCPKMFFAKWRLVSLAVIDGFGVGGDKLRGFSRMLLKRAGNVCDWPRHERSLKVMEGSLSRGRAEEAGAQENTYIAEAHALA